MERHEPRVYLPKTGNPSGRNTHALPGKQLGNGTYCHRHSPRPGLSSCRNYKIQIYSYWIPDEEIIIESPFLRAVSLGT